MYFVVADSSSHGVADLVVLLADWVAMLAQKQDARSLFARQQEAWTVEMAAVDRTAVEVQSWFVYEIRESGSLTVSAPNLTHRVRAESHSPCPRRIRGATISNQPGR